MAQVKYGTGTIFQTKDGRWKWQGYFMDDMGKKHRPTKTFNTEAEGVDESLIVPKGMKTLGINPLNWKTDSTPADKTENLGACFTRYSGEIKKEIAELTGAYLDESRGTLRATDINPSDYSNSLFPDGVYHLYDYQFFYRNLQENVAVRLERFLENAR